MDNQIFDNINGYSLDKEQRQAIVSNKNTLVVAGAGSGKTLTIIGKIKYLTEVMKVIYKEILCISFTNQAVNNLKERLGLDIDWYTFHKLALEILKDNHVFYQVASSDSLEYTVNEYFEGFIEDEYLKYITGYFVDIAKDNDINLEKIKDWKNYNDLVSKYKYIILERKENAFYDIMNNNVDIKKHSKNFSIVSDYRYNDISSSLVRDKIKNNEDVSNLISKEIEAYIKENNLYK